MSFDRVAPHYRWLETVAFGRQLQRARLAFVREIDPPRRVLIVGEGDGRFLAEFVRLHPRATIDCLEASARMTSLARARMGVERVNFICANICEVTLPDATYDLVVTHFLLDCFAEETLAALLAKLATCTARSAQWLIADFYQPAKGWQRWRARFLISIMYRFFRITSRIEARRLVDPSPLLRGIGFQCIRQFLSGSGMIKSELWRRLA